MMTGRESSLSLGFFECGYLPSILKSLAENVCRKERYLRCHHLHTFSWGRSQGATACYFLRTVFPLCGQYLIPDLNCLKTPPIFLSISDTWLVRVTGRAGRAVGGQVYRPSGRPAGLAGPPGALRSHFTVT